jgi:hypothetical protein
MWTLVFGMKTDVVTSGEGSPMRHRSPFPDEDR